MYLRVSIWGLSLDGPLGDGGAAAAIRHRRRIVLHVALRADECPPD
jgi:hypothetical protein